MSWCAVNARWVYYEKCVTGLHFEVGNPTDLAEKVRWMIVHPEACRQRGVNARNEYFAKYTAEKNYQMMIDLYQQAIDSRKAAKN
ncbi:MAG: hypothetical protein DRQ61_11410 [Gammaproteobacteria bacterium]|nr:MAG: hypothetical protein DRQ61_11410 [Gammaproteobacteria bacterium]